MKGAKTAASVETPPSVIPPSLNDPWGYRPEIVQ